MLQMVRNSLIPVASMQMEIFYYFRASKLNCGNRFLPQQIINGLRLRNHS